jgi:hypothetical protein
MTANFQDERGRADVDRVRAALYKLYMQAVGAARLADAEAEAAEQEKDPSRAANLADGSSEMRTGDTCAGKGCRHD